MKFNKKDLRDMIYEGECNSLILIEDNITGTGRWCINHTLVFKYDERFYTVPYQVGATENQDEGPFEYSSSDEIECEECVAIPMTKINYIPVSKVGIK